MLETQLTLLKSLSEKQNKKGLKKEYLQMQSIWKQEKLTNDILPYKSEIINDSLMLLERRRIELKAIEKNEESLFIEIILLDSQRFQYLIEDYHRIRLFKIEKYILYIIKKDLGSLLSEKEFDYAFELFKLQRAYFNQGLFKKINPSLNDLNSISNHIVISPPIYKYIIIMLCGTEDMVIELKRVYPFLKEGNLILSDLEFIFVPEICVSNDIENGFFSIV